MVAHLHLSDFAALFFVSALLVLTVPCGSGMAADADADFRAREAASREVTRALEESRKAVDSLVNAQRERLRDWTGESRRHYSDYYRIALDQGPDSPEARAAREMAGQGDREYWNGRSREIQDDWKEFDKQAAGRSEKTRAALERAGVRGLGALSAVPSSPRAGAKPRPPVPALAPSGNSTQNTVAGSPPADTSPAASPARPVWVLDGSQIPKELVFPGRKR